MKTNQNSVRHLKKQIEKLKKDGNFREETLIIIIEEISNNIHQLINLENRIKSLESKLK